MVAGLRTLGVLYVLGAAALGFGLALRAQQPWALGAKQIAEAVPPVLGVTAYAANEVAIKPAWAWTARTASGTWQQVSDYVWPQPVAVPKPVPKSIIAAAKPKPAAPPALRPSINPSAAQAPAATGAAPKMQLAETETENAPLTPAPDTTPPSPGEVARVLAHLKISLTKELYDNFGLFLYVSKADHGPWHQRMFVFNKETSGDLKMMYSFPVSTGRETLMPNPGGSALWNTNTPTGYFQLDPDRVYRRYTSQQWGHKMPYAMFFSWEHEGRQTGVAIHSAIDGDVQLLGNRASAGCVRLAPQNAELLFRLIKKDYRGLTPLFAYDRRTATMSKEGLLMHDKQGKLAYAEGYRVLVLIENTGGDDIVAALF
jgi:lipoprotein-anchoring transpeptidase ErfK/SrfK